MRRLAATGLLVVILLALRAVAAPAQAGSGIQVGVIPAGITYGGHAELGGSVSLGGVRRPGVTVALEYARIPRGRFARSRSTVTTDAAGLYRFRIRGVRGYRLRARADALGLVSRAVPLYVVPYKRLGAVRVRHRRAVRLTLVALTPNSVRLYGRALFYVGRRGAPRRFRGTAPVRRVTQGVFRATLTVPLPRGGRGSFAYGSCYHPPRATGMQNPHFRCTRAPRRPLR